VPRSTLLPAVDSRDFCRLRGLQNTVPRHKQVLRKRRLSGRRPPTISLELTAWEIACRFDVVGHSLTGPGSGRQLTSVDGSSLQTTPGMLDTPEDHGRSSCARTPSGSVTGAWQAKPRHT
jgi:hypothetical protein